MPLDGKTEVFAFFRTDTKERFIFDIDEIKTGIKENKIKSWRVTTPITRNDYVALLKQHGIEIHHLTNDMKDIDEPIISVMFDSKRFACIDGNHRIVKRYRNGLREGAALIVPLALIDFPPYTYRVDKFPEAFASVEAS